jgi:hypothetical protein
MQKNHLVPFKKLDHTLATTCGRLPSGMRLEDDVLSSFLMSTCMQAPSTVELGNT